MPYVDEEYIVRSMDYYGLGRFQYALRSKYTRSRTHIVQWMRTKFN